MGWPRLPIGEHRNASHYGSDISAVMVQATQAKCSECMLTTMDLGVMQHSSWRGPVAADWPDSFDIVVVSDVLLYLQLAGTPLVLDRVLPAALTPGSVAALRRVYTALTGLARTAVIFSDHQGMRKILTVLEEMGATYHRPLQTHSRPGIYVANGTWRPNS